MPHDQLSRRDYLRLATAGVLTGVSVPWFEAMAQAAAVRRPRGKACILLWMDGGPTHYETFDPKRSLLSERFQGTFADQVVVPRQNLVPKPPSLSFEEAACLPTAWLTAYRMLFAQGGLKAGDTVLVDDDAHHHHHG